MKKLEHRGQISLSLRRLDFSVVWAGLTFNFLHASQSSFLKLDGSHAGATIRWSCQLSAILMQNLLIERLKAAIEKVTMETNDIVACMLLLP